MEKKTFEEDKKDREMLLGEYVKRLSHGDSLEAVRKDFVAHFQSVDAAEIVQAEQNLISGGTPLTDVQKLCDVHSALFHGATQAEQIENAEKAAQDAVSKAGQRAYELSFSKIPGHPVDVFAAENRAISGLINETRKALAAGTDDNALSEALKALYAASVHYTEKGDLIYPLLKSKYDVTGPADVMWAVDDEIRKELRFLSKADSTRPDYTERIGQLLARAEEMIYKEKNILLPLCAEHFTEEDWMKIYYELPSYDSVLSGERPVWDAAEQKRKEQRRGQAGKAGYVPGANNPIPLGSGHMTPEQIESVLNTIPMELTFIDDKNINCFFSKGERIFKRPDEAVGREVFLCHPPKYAAMARQIIDELRSGKKDSVDVWLNKGGGPLLVRYMAVRNENGEYAGTLECVQKMGFAMKRFSKSNAQEKGGS